MQGYLDRVRSALRGESCSPGLRVLARHDALAPSAFLVTLRRQGGDLILPLRGGLNFVGRGSEEGRPFGVLPRPYPLEQSQWFVLCRTGEALVSDAWSTNLSYLVPAGLDLGDAPDQPFGFSEVEGLVGAIRLPHRNEPCPQHEYPLREGDRLRSCYAWFLFGWL